MPIITLTSDLGSNSHYAAILKGLIYSAEADITVVDVSHQISNFDIMEAAYVLRHTYQAFPAGTIHVVAVDPDESNTAKSMVMLHDQHYFIGPDNGVMNLISCGQTRSGHLINNPSLFNAHYPRSFRAAQIFVPTAIYLATGGKVGDLGPVTDFVDLRWGEPSYSDNSLRGKIIYIDKFGNAVTNIRKDNFLHLKQERAFEIFVRNVRLKRIVNTYADVAKADALAIFGESQHLEIAMREASAAELLGLKIHDMLTIEFYGG